MAYIAANFAVSSLADDLAIGGTLLNIQSVDIPKFPVINNGGTGTDYSFLALRDALGNKEIVKVTRHDAAASAHTIERGQGGTTARAWVANDPDNPVSVSNTLVASVIMDAFGHAGVATGAHEATAISFDPAGNIAATDVQAAIEELDTEKEPVITVLPVERGGTGGTTLDNFAASIGAPTVESGGTYTAPVKVTQQPVLSEELTNKLYVDNRVAARPLARQSLLVSPVNSSGDPAYLVGTGSNRSRLATVDGGTAGTAISIACGFSSGVPKDEVVMLGAASTVLPASYALDDNSLYNIFYTLENDLTADPNLLSLLHFDGANASTMFYDETGLMWSRSGAAELSTAWSKFGTASLVLNSETACIYRAPFFENYTWNQTSQMYEIVPVIADATVEFFINFYSQSSALQPIYNSCSINVYQTFHNTFGGQSLDANLLLIQESVGGPYKLAYVHTTHTSPYNVNTITQKVVGSTAILANTGYHIAIVKTAGTIKVYLNGNLEITATPYTDELGEHLTQQIGGRAYGPSVRFPNGTTATQVGYITGMSAVRVDEYARTRAVKYSANFTPMTSAMAPTIIPPGFRSTKMPCQYGFAFNKAAGSLMKFKEAANTWGSYDEFGNLWTSVGVVCDGSGSYTYDTPGRASFNGTSQYIYSNAMTYLGSGAWTMDCVVNSALGAANSVDTVINAGQSGTVYGVLLEVLTNAGGNGANLRLYLSSDGSTHDIASAVVAGTAFPTSTDVHVSVVFDGSSYKVYQAGTAVITVSSSKPITNIAKLALGANCNTTPTNYLTGSFKWFRYSQAPLFLASFSAPVNPKLEGYWFDTSSMQMKRLKSPTALTANPAFDIIRAIFLGKAQTGAAGVDTTLTLRAPGLSEFATTSAINEAKMWANFDGTGVVSIRDAHNVAGLTDNGVGDWAITLRTQTQSLDQVVLANAGSGYTAAAGVETQYTVHPFKKGFTPSTTTIRIGCVSNTAGTVAAADAPFVCVALFSR